MDTLKHEFKAVFKTPMEAEGFTYAGNCFYRHINDIIQILTLNRVYDVGFYFAFTIVPVCLPITRIFPSGFLKPIEYYYTKPPQHFHRPFDPDWSSEKIRKFMESGLEVVFREVIPLFHRGIDSRHAYPEIMEYHKKLFSPCGKTVPNSIVLMWLALQAENYELAYNHLAAIIAQNMGFCPLDEQELLLPHRRKAWETVTAEDDSLLIKMRSDLVRISVHDKSYFDPIIAKNTKLTLEFLEKARKSPCKYGSSRY